MQGQYSEVLIHPTSILSITDHHMRSKQERVVGIALGIIIDNILHVTNTYAVPFEEKSESLWFLDTTYLITMYDLLRRVTISEKIIGWYHTGGSIFKNDMSISKSLEQFVERPFLMVVDVHSYNTLPIKLLRYENNDFVYTKYDIVSDEPEKIGLEHMIKVMRIDHFYGDELILTSLDSYRQSLEKIENYLEDVIQGKIRKNYKILYILQECLLNRPDISCSEEKKALECYALELTRAIVDLNELEHNRNENKIKSN